MFSENDKIELIKRINSINKKKNKKKLYTHLFNLINENNIKYTNNLNGIFFNINNIDENILKKINIFLDSLDDTSNNTDTDTITTDI